MKGCHAKAGERTNSAASVPQLQSEPSRLAKITVRRLASFRWMIPLTEGNEIALGTAAKIDRWFP
jgi:hypothetical protein